MLAPVGYSRRINAYRHTQTHTHARTHARTHAYKHTHTHTHTRTHARTHACTHARTHEIYLRRAGDSYLEVLRVRDREQVSRYTHTVDVSSRPTSTQLAQP